MFDHLSSTQMDESHGMRSNNRKEQLIPIQQYVVLSIAFLFSSNRFQSTISQTRNYMRNKYLKCCVLNDCKFWVWVKKLLEFDRMMIFFTE